MSEESTIIVTAQCKRNDLHNCSQCFSDNYRAFGCITTLSYCDSPRVPLRVGDKVLWKCPDGAGLSSRVNFIVTSVTSAPIVSEEEEEENYNE